MRLYGYREGADEEAPAALEEITVAASPATLRRLAAFFDYVADEMDRAGSAFNHEHFGDYAREMRGAPAVVIARETEGAAESGADP